MKAATVLDAISQDIVPELISSCWKTGLANLPKKVSDMLLGESKGLSNVMSSLTMTGNEGWKEETGEQSMCWVVCPLIQHQPAG